MRHLEVVHSDLPKLACCNAHHGCRRAGTTRAICHLELLSYQHRNSDKACGAVLPEASGSATELEPTAASRAPQARCRHEGSTGVAVAARDQKARYAGQKKPPKILGRGHDGGHDVERPTRRGPKDARRATVGTPDALGVHQPRRVHGRQARGCRPAAASVGAAVPPRPPSELDRLAVSDRQLLQHVHAALLGARHDQFLPFVWTSKLHVGVAAAAAEDWEEE